MKLQQKLELIQQNDYTQLQTIDLNELTFNMIHHIGTTDSYIRDMLIYKCFAHFIQKELLSLEQLELLLTTCLDENFLYIEIDTPGTDGVFTRSYTNLLIALIIQFDNTHPFLSSETIRMVKEKLIEYMNLEADYRGYIQKKGYAHAIAHGSEALNALVHNSNISCDCYEEIIHCLLNKVFVCSTVYHNQEDERIVTPLLSIIHHDFPQNHFLSIIYKKLQRLPQIRKRISMHEYCALCANIQLFLRTLFFRSKEDFKLISISSQMEKILKEFAQYYRI